MDRGSRAPPVLRCVRSAISTRNGCSRPKAIFQPSGRLIQPKELGSDPDVDLVIIATPPNTHALLAMQMMAAGKHVVCEKPLALNRAETDAMAEAALGQAVHLSCHQNRRWTWITWPSSKFLRRD